MGKRLQADENGRLPLSPSAQRLYDHLRPLMGARWWCWEQLLPLCDNVTASSQSTLISRVHQMVVRGWMVKESMLWEPTGRHRDHFALPREMAQFLCAGCEQWQTGMGEYLCEACRYEI